MRTTFEDDLTIPHVTRNDGMKTTLYALVGLTIAFALIASTIWLFVAG